METLSLSKSEIALLIGLMNAAVQSGKLQLGDVVNMTPLVIKINEKLKEIEKRDSGKDKKVLSDGVENTN